MPNEKFPHIESVHVPPKESLDRIEKHVAGELESMFDEQWQMLQSYIAQGVSPESEEYRVVVERVDRLANEIEHITRDGLSSTSPDIYAHADIELESRNALIDEDRLLRFELTKRVRSDISDPRIPIIARRLKEIDNKLTHLNTEMRARAEQTRISERDNLRQHSPPRGSIRRDAAIPPLRRSGSGQNTPAAFQPLPDEDLP